MHVLLEFQQPLLNNLDYLTYVFWCLCLCHHQCPSAVIGYFTCVWKNYILNNLVCYSFVPAPVLYCWRLSCSLLFYLVCVILTVNWTCAFGFLCGSDLWWLFLVGCVFVAVFSCCWVHSTMRRKKKAQRTCRYKTTTNPVHSLYFVSKLIHL
jgi:hypothetical protein